MFGFYDRLQIWWQETFSSNALRLAQDDIKHLQSACTDHTVEILSLLPRSKQRRQMQMIERLAELPLADQDHIMHTTFFEMIQNDCPDKKDEEDLRKLQHIGRCQIRLVDLLNCRRLKDNESEEKNCPFDDVCSRAVGRSLTANELKEAKSATRNQFHFFATTWGVDEKEAQELERNEA